MFLAEVVVLLSLNTCFLRTLLNLIAGPFSKSATSDLSLITMEMKSSHKQSPEIHPAELIPQPFHDFSHVRWATEMTKVSCDFPGLARATLQAWCLFLGAKQHPEFPAITEWLSHGWGAPQCRRGHLPPTGVGDAAAAAHRGCVSLQTDVWLFGQWVRCVHMMWSLCKAGACHGAAGGLCSGWGHCCQAGLKIQINRQGIFLCLPPFRFCIFLDVKQIKWNNFFRNILLY